MKTIAAILVTSALAAVVILGVASGQSAPSGPAGNALPPSDLPAPVHDVSPPAVDWAGGQQPYRVTLPPDFPILQPRAASPTKLFDQAIGETVYYVPNVLTHVSWGILPNRTTKPIITVPSGALVQFDVLSHEGLLEDQGRDPVAFFGRYGIPADDVLDDAKRIAAAPLLHKFYHDGPHVISPPVAVQNARPGDVLAIDVVRLEPRVPYGVNAIRHGLGALPDEFPPTPSEEPGADAAHPERFHNVFFVIPIRPEQGRWFGYLPTGRGRDTKIPIEPFLGIMGVAEDTPVLPSSVPPGRQGGNLDLHNLTEGSRLYLPVLVPGALFYVSDSHFAQGNGEVSLTAIEGSLRATLRLTLLRAGDQRLPMPAPLELPFAENADYWIPLGIAGELDVAMVNCLHQTLQFLQYKLGMKPDNALAFASTAVNFDISEVVDRMQEVHALIPKADFPWIKADGTFAPSSTGPVIRP